MPTPLPRPSHRPLMVYALDPMRGTKLGNHMTVRVPYEELKPGPQGPMLEVMDYDATNKRYYEPVDLNAPELLLRNGLSPTESDPRFHQQMVYAVARETIDQFERALGRPVRWGYRRKTPLRIFPHAMHEANAYYDRKLKAIVFGYFAASAADVGANLPNQTVYTCLSHDIIAHETTHALLDGQRRYYMQDTNPDVPAFHEGFADIVALFQHFTYPEVLYDTMVRTGGKIFKAQLEPRLSVKGETPVLSRHSAQDNPLIGLAQQFGEAVGKRAALRTALMFPPKPGAMDEVFDDPHERGGILVAAVFDAFFSAFEQKTADLFRIARAGGTAVIADDIHPTLAQRLSEEAAKIAQHFVSMCIRAIDYCPPVDITFGDYLRALITADYDLYPDDRYGYREAVIESFRQRGIYPEGVISMAETSLLWDGPHPAPKACRGLDLHVKVSANARARRGQPETEPDDADSTRPPEDPNYEKLYKYARDPETRKILCLVEDPEATLSVEGYQPLVRTNEGVPRIEAVAMFVQRKDVPLDPADPDSPKLRVYGGSTVHFDERGNVRYVIRRRLTDGRPDSRVHRVRGYWEGKRDLTYVDREDALDKIDTQLNFALVHKGI